MLAAVVVVLAVAYPDGRADPLPAPLEEVFPAPGDTVLGPPTVQIDLPVGYAISLVIDGRPVPPDEIVVTEAVGVFRWQPGVDGWRAGEHTIEVAWDTLPGRLPDPGAFSWRFRTT